MGAAPPRSYSVSKRRKVEKASGGRLFAGNPRRGALVPSGHRSAPTEAAAETLDGIFDATEVSSKLSCHPAPSVCRPLFSPAGSVGAGRSPLGSCAISDGGGTRMGESVGTFSGGASPTKRLREFAGKTAPPPRKKP